METRRRADTRRHPPAGTGASLAPSLPGRPPGPGPPRSLPGRAASHGAAPPHAGWLSPRSGLCRGRRRGWGAGAGRRGCGAAGASRGPGAASRNAEVSAGGGLLTPSRAAAASAGAARECGHQARAAGPPPPPPPSPAPRPGRRGQAVPGRLRSGRPWRRPALRLAPRPLTLRSGSHLPSSEVAGGPGALARG